MHSKFMYLLVIYIRKVEIENIKMWILTGDGQGDVLAEDNDFSLSSGSSTELMRIFLAESSLLL
jgi:hypothetical protein